MFNHTDLNLIIPYLTEGGGNKVMVDIANYLSKSNQVTIYTFSNSISKFEIDKKIKIKYLTKKKNRFNFFISLIKIIFILNLSRKKFIISDPILSLLTIICCNKINIYRYIQANDYIIFDDRYVIKNVFLIKIFKVLTKISYSLKINFIFNSRYVFKSFFQNSYVKRKIKPVILNPYVDERIFNKTNKFIVKNKNSYVVSTIARKHPWKGFILFKKLIQLHINKPKIKKIKIITPDKIKFTHHKIEIINPKNFFDIAKHLNETDIFISTSWWEGYGLPQLESLNCNCFGLFSDSKGINEFSKNYQNVILFKSKSFLNLNKKFLDILNNSINIKQYLSKNNLYTKKVSRKNFYKQLDTIFN